MISEQNNRNIQPYSSIEEDGISYQEIIYILRRHQGMILFITGLVLILTLFYTSLQKSVYESSGLIMIDDPIKMNMFDMSSYWSEQNYLSNESKFYCCFRFSN